MLVYRDVNYILNGGRGDPSPTKKTILYTVGEAFRLPLKNKPTVR
jgi:hypothetical protein